MERRERLQAKLDQTTEEQATIRKLGMEVAAKCHNGSNEPEMLRYARRFAELERRKEECNELLDLLQVSVERIDRTKWCENLTKLCVPHS